MCNHRSNQHLETSALNQDGPTYLDAVKISAKSDEKLEESKVRQLIIRSVTSIAIALVMSISSCTSAVYSPIAAEPKAFSQLLPDKLTKAVERALTR